MISMFASITGQETSIGSSGDGSERYPRQVSTFVELRGTLEAPLKGSSDLVISVNEADEEQLELELPTGMINAVKPTVHVAVWVHQMAMQRLISLIAANRITAFDAVSEPTRYGRSRLLSWTLRTKPEDD